MNKKNNILITGASGFLGKSLLKRLRTQPSKFDIFASVLNSSEKDSFQHLDLLDLEELKKTIYKFKPDIVFHLAANVDLSRDFAVAKKCIETNIIGTLNLLESLKQCPPKKVIFTSTEEVYGNGPLPFKEDQLSRPPSAYSISKIASENLCQVYAKELGFSLLIFRIATFYGPGSPLHRFIPQLILNSLRHEKILLNSGIKKRDYVFVDDVVDAFILALEKKHSNIELLNLGGGKSYTLKEVVALITKLTGSRSNVVLNAIPERLFEADVWLMDIAKAQKSLGWKPVTPLKEGLQQTIDFFSKNFI